MEGFVFGPSFTRSVSLPGPRNPVSVADPPCIATVYVITCSMFYIVLIFVL